MFEEKEVEFELEEGDKLGLKIIKASKMYLLLSINTLPFQDPNTNLGAVIHALTPGGMVYMLIYACTLKYSFFVECLG